jgi:putative transposase
MPVKRRGPDPGLLHHSDQGCTYASEDYRARLEQHGITLLHEPRQLLRRRRYGELVSTVKSEARDHFESYAHAKEALFDYIEVFYDQRRGEPVTSSWAVRHAGASMSLFMSLVNAALHDHVHPAN